MQASPVCVLCLGQAGTAIGATLVNALSAAAKPSRHCTSPLPCGFIFADTDGQALDSAIGRVDASTRSKIVVFGPNELQSTSSSQSSTFSSPKTHSRTQEHLQRTLETLASSILTHIDSQQGLPSTLLLIYALGGSTGTRLVSLILKAVRTQRLPTWSPSNLPSHSKASASIGRRAKAEASTARQRRQQSMLSQAFSRMLVYSACVSPFASGDSPIQWYNACIGLAAQLRSLSPAHNTTSDSSSTSQPSLAAQMIASTLRPPLRPAADMILLMPNDLLLAEAQNSPNMVTMPTDASKADATRAASYQDLNKVAARTIVVAILMPLLPGTSTILHGEKHADTGLLAYGPQHIHLTPIPTMNIVLATSCSQDFALKCLKRTNGSVADAVSTCAKAIYKRMPSRMGAHGEERADILAAEIVTVVSSSLPKSVIREVQDSSVAACAHIALKLPLSEVDEMPLKSRVLVNRSNWNQDFSCALVANSRCCVDVLKRISQRASSMLCVGAFLHHPEMNAADIEHALTIVNACIDDYTDFLGPPTK